jgi:Ni2+-binding GTPase involved in maturation of urease and hydrogenase
VEGSETEGILYTVYSMAQQFHEHKMDVIKMDLLTRNKEKSVYADGDLLVFSVMGAASGNICICS